MTGTTVATQNSILAAADATDDSAIPQLRMHVVTVTQAGYSQLMADPSVKRVELDQTRVAEAAPSDSSYPAQWSLPQIGWDQAYGTVNPSGSSVVAVLDTGVDGSVPDLAGQLVPGTSILDGTDGTTDPNGHGTWMAGIIAAKVDNGIDVAGIGYAGVKVMPITVLGADGVGQDSDIIAGVVWAVDNGADVINMSFSSPGFSPALQAAFDYAWSNNVVLVAATGNDGFNAATFPAGDRGVIGVSNTDQSDSLDASSNYGPDVFLAAPGVGILTTAPGGGAISISGSSASAAEVSAAAALLRAVDPSASNGTIVGRLARNADPAGTQEQTGNGRLNLDRALRDGANDWVQPNGAGPLGGGGPYVGPFIYTAAAIAFGTVATTVTATTTISITKPASANTGDFLIAALAYNGGTGTSFTSVPSGWTLIRNTTGGTNVGIATYWHVVGASDPGPYAWTISGSATERLSGGILRYTGVDPTTPIDASNGNTGTDTTLEAPTVTTTLANDMVIAFYAVDDLLTGLSTPSSTTERYDITNTDANGPGTSADDFTQVAGGATPVRTSTRSPNGAGETWVSQQVALRPGAPITSVTAVTFAGSSQAAGAVANWTVGFTTSSSGALNTGKTITAIFNPGFTVPATPTIALNTGFTSCTATATATGQTVTITLAGASCAVANSAAATLTINGITNPAVAGSLAANTFSARTSVDTAVVNPASPIVIVAGTATKLVITSVNGGANPTAGTAFNVVIQSQDTNGNLANVTSNTDLVLSLTTGTGTLAGTLTGTILSGQSSGTVTGVTYTKAESGVVLTATRTAGMTLASGASASFTVNPGAAHHLAFLQQPTTTQRTLTMTPAVTVRILDANNNVANVSSVVTLAIANNPSSGTLSGSVAVSAVSGLATFSTLSINNVGVAYTLGATSPSVTGVTSTAFDITFLACSWKASGTVGGTWVTGSNWTGCTGSGGIPGLTDDVVIPASNTNPQVPSGATQINSLNITTGTLTLNTNGVLDVATNVTNTGTLTLISSGVLAIGGVFTSSGTFSSASTAAVEYSGSGNQNILPLTYGILRLKNGGTKAATAGFTVAGLFSIDGPSTFDAGSFTEHFQGSITNIGTYSAGTSTAIFDGSAVNPNFGGSLGHTIVFNNVIVNRGPSTAVSVTGVGGAQVAGDLTVQAGTLDLAGNTFNHSGAPGNILNVANGAFLRINGDDAFPTGFATVTLGATSTVDYYGGSQSVAGVAYGHLTLSGTDSTLAGNASVAGILALNAETLTTGAFTIAANSSVTRSTGFVIGNLLKPVNTGTLVARTFEIGTGATYAPVTVTFASVSTLGNLTASSSDPDHGSLATSDIDPNRSVNRFWTLTGSGGLAFTTYTAAVTFAATDLDGPTTTAAGQLAMRAYVASTWVTPSSSVNTSTTATGSGFAGLGDLAVGNVNDFIAPTVANVTATNASATYGAGTTIGITVQFSEIVAVNTGGGTPSLALNNGGTATYASGSGTNTLTFNYVVLSGDSAVDLDYASASALALNGGTIGDFAANAAVLTLAAPGDAGSLGANKDIAINTVSPTVTNVTSTTLDGTYGIGQVIPVTVTFSTPVVVTGTPRITLETGATDALVNYLSGTGSSTLVFNYTVATGQNSLDLDYVSTTALALNGGTIKDTIGNSAVLTLAAPGAAGSIGANKALVIDAIVPAVTNVTSTVGDGTYGIGSVIPVTVTFSKLVNVIGTPTLTLSTGSPSTTAVSYTSGSGTNTLTFNYTVIAGNNTGDLNYSATTSLTAGTSIKDSAGNNAVLTLAGLAAAGSLGTNKAIVIVATRVWTGAVSTNWSVGGNWSGGTVPTSGETATIPNVATQPTIVSAAGTIAALVINTGATLTVGNGGTLTVSGAVTDTGTLVVATGGTITFNGTWTINGSLSVSGTVVNATGGSKAGSATPVFNAGGTYVHAQNSGTIPTATWDINSTMSVTGWTTGTDNPPAGINQSFGNFTWNSTSQTASDSFAGALISVRGNFTIASTGSASGDIRLGNTGAGNLAVGGNYVQTGGTILLSSTQGAARTMTVAGNFTQSGGTLDLSNSTTSGNTVTVFVAGNFSHTAGTLTESGSTTASGITFNGTTPQTLTSGGTTSNTVNYTVNSGATLNLGTNALGIGSTGTFALASGGTLGIGDPAGITTSGATGNVRVSGTRTYATAANYTYNGSVAQAIGNGMPVTVNNLTIANSAGVTLGVSTTVNGTLALTSGDLTTGVTNVTQPTTAPASTGTGDVVGTVIRTGAFADGTAYTFGNPNNRLARTSGTSPTAVSLKLVKSVPALKANAVTRTYTVTPTGGSGYTATVRLHYLDTELNGNSEAFLELWHLSGTWSSQSQDSRDATANWVEKTGVALATLSGDWTLANSADATPPVLTITSPTAFASQSATSFNVTFDATDVGSGVNASTLSLQRQRIAVAIAGTCPASVYTNDGSAVTPAVSPVTSTGLLDGFCYQWVLTGSDNVGNVGTPATSARILVDTGAPTVLSIVRVGPNPTNAASIAWTVTFSEPVTGVDQSDFDLTLGGAVSSITGVTGSSAVYTVTASASGNGTVELDLIDDLTIVDGVGNPLAAGATGEVYSIDNTNPTASISSGPAILTNSTSATFVFSGSDPSVNGVSSGVASFECKLDAGAYAGCTSGLELTGLEDGLHTFLVRAIDVAGNTGTADSSTWTVDAAAPTVTINQGSTQFDPTNVGPVTFDVVFSEAVTGFDGSDVIISGTATYGAPVVTGTGTSYTVSVPVTGDGTVIASIPAAAALDLAGNGNAASTFTDSTVTYDASAPTVLSINRVGLSPTSADSIAWTVTFSEPVSGVDALDFGLTSFGATTTFTSITGGPSVYTVTASASDDGTIGLNLTDDDLIVDAVGNPLGGVGLVNGDATGQPYAIDNTAPTAVIATNPTDPTSMTSAIFTFTSSDPTVNTVSSGVASFECSLDGVTYGPCLSGLEQLTGLVDGSYTFYVRAIDSAGNTGAPDDFTWTVDATVPSVVDVSSATANASYSNGATISIQVVFSEPVTVTGTPQLTLETGTTDAITSYLSGSGTTTLTFNYAVGLSDSSLDLDYVSTTSLALNGGSIRDISNDAVLDLPVPGALHSLSANKDIVIVGTRSTTTSVTSDVNPAGYGTTVNFTATVSVVSPGAGTPTGSVEFFDDVDSLGVSALSGGEAALPIATLTVGSHDITAVYAADVPSFTGSTSGTPAAQAIGVPHAHDQRQ